MDLMFCRHLTVTVKPTPMWKWSVNCAREPSSQCSSLNLAAVAAMRMITLKTTAIRIVTEHCSPINYVHCVRQITYTEDNTTDLAFNHMDVGNWHQILSWAVVMIAQRLYCFIAHANGTMRASGTDGAHSFLIYYHLWHEIAGKHWQAEYLHLVFSS